MKINYKKKNVIKKIMAAGAAVIAVCAAGFGWYVSDYYHAGDTAKQILQDTSLVTAEKDWLVLENGDSDIGFIFYPGAKVEYISYLPLMQALNEAGISCYLAEMPFHLAFFGSQIAADIIEANPEIESWYMGGHSLGGAFASSFAAAHPEEIDGLILLGAYLYGEYPAEKTLTVYGSEDLVLNRDKITYDENIEILEGGNHAQFGDYGEQDGDGAAAIAAEEQIAQTTEKVIAFLDKQE